MSIFDDIKGKAEDLVSGNEDKIKDGVEKAGDFIDSKTDAKFKDQVDGVQKAASDFLDRTAK
ncbi:antitoxin [Arthrobacter cryoconiti]|uniref:Antitoxin n=1 Tax=Arthrobacter cryoconiti TaxID=748907 RepID=A0ABV8QUS3_9MICC|nr:antitoxin [Arthrobacter cryoconiti]MCC9069740.1 antitoxin [Arthrobacter cryoconiti]